jgi:hypothetical protein
VPTHPAEIEAFRTWLPRGRVDQKRADAVALLERMRADLSAPGDAAAPVTAPHLTSTVLWNEVVRQETPLTAILEEFLLAVTLSRAVAEGVARTS